MLLRTAGSVALAFSAVAAGAMAQNARAPTAPQVLRALSQRSGLSEANLIKTIADCAANQTAIYFCGYRDMVAAEMKLQHAVDDRSQRFPACRTKFEAEVMNWKKDMVAGCKKNAKEDYGGGSMEPAAVVLCQAGSTEYMVKTMRSRRGCQGVKR